MGMLLPKELRGSCTSEPGGVASPPYLMPFEQMPAKEKLAKQRASLQADSILSLNSFGNDYYKCSFNLEMSDSVIVSHNIS